MRLYSFVSKDRLSVGLFSTFTSFVSFYTESTLDTFSCTVHQKENVSYLSTFIQGLDDKRQFRWQARSAFVCNCKPVVFREAKALISVTKNALNVSNICC